jgi:DNA replication protein DnaC
MAQNECPLCGGTGWKIVEGSATVPPGKARVPEAVAKQAREDGAKAIALEGPGFGIGLPRVAVLCDCTRQERTTMLLSKARIPLRYRDCDFESFEADLPHEGSEADCAKWNRSLKQAKTLLQGFSREYLPVKTGQDNNYGLLLMGSCGVGKTHLAVAALREVVLRGHSGLFYDYRELLKEIQSSYSPETQATEMSVLDPVLNAEVLLLDDLGASKPSLWALETVGHILNSRYNSNRVSLITTNYLDAETAAPSGRLAAVEDTLTDRVGKRIRSRLFEMCRTVEVTGPDYRREIRHAGRFRG